MAGMVKVVGSVGLLLLLALIGACDRDRNASDSEPADGAVLVCEADSPELACAELTPESATVPEHAVCDVFVPECPTVWRPDERCELLYGFTAPASGVHLFAAAFVPPTDDGYTHVPAIELIDAGEPCGVTGDVLGCSTFTATSLGYKGEIALCLQAGQEIVVGVSELCGGDRITVEHTMPRCPQGWRKLDDHIYEPIHTLGPEAPDSEVLHMEGGKFGNYQLFDLSCAAPPSSRPQMSLEFVAPAAGDYVFGVENPDGSGSAVGIVGDDCCGQELACAAADEQDPPAPAEVTVTLSEGQTVIVVGQNHAFSFDEASPEMVISVRRP
jgi:hypothetical protein